MNGFIKTTAAAICCSAGLLTLIGCNHYRDIVDPCRLERYSSLARGSVVHMHNVQAEKGHILNQTLWNDDFDADNKLKPSGMVKLKYIAHREPTAQIMKVWLQNAADDDPAKRVTINTQRSNAMLAYLEKQRDPGQPTQYEVDVHNYDMPTYPAIWSEKSFKAVELNIEFGKMPQFVRPITTQ